MDFNTWHTLCIFSQPPQMAPIYHLYLKGMLQFSLCFHVIQKLYPQPNAAMETVICWLLFLFHQSDKVDPFKKKRALVSGSYSM